MCAEASTGKTKQGSSYAGLMDRRSAERALQAAREAAHRAVTRAAFLAGAAGMDYSAPPGFPVDMQSIPKVARLACNFLFAHTCSTCGERQE